VDELGAGGRLHLGEDRFARRGRGLAFGDDAAIAAHGVLLGLRRGARHHDVAGNAAPSGSVGQRQRVVPARMRRHALLRHLVRQAEHRVRGAAHLEGAGLLEVLALEEQLGPGELVEVARGQDRRAVDMGLDPLVRGDDVVVGRDLHGRRHLVHGALLHAATRSAPAVPPR
jgi:hypothetical protein